jgi:hypothetical protein
MATPAAQQDRYTRSLGRKAAKRVKRARRQNFIKAKPPRTGSPPAQPPRTTYGHAAKPQPQPITKRLLTWADLRELGVFYHPHYLRKLWMRDPPAFPPPLRITPGRLCWRASEVLAWLEAKERGR